MDIEANNYPFPYFLCFLTLKSHPSFLLTTTNHKSCTLSHNFLYNRKIYLKTKLLKKICFKARFLHPNTGEMKLAQECQPHRRLVTFYHTVWRVTESHQINEVRSFLILIFNQYAPPIFFISVSHNFNTQKFVIKKIVKNTCFVIFI